MEPNAQSARIVRETRIFETVVEAVVAALPELDRLRSDSETSSKGQQRKSVRCRTSVSGVPIASREPGARK